MNTLPPSQAGANRSVSDMTFTDIEPYRDREDWRVEAERVGTDFPTLIKELAVVAGVVACDSCGQSPCINPSFCKLCRAADREHRPRISRSRQPTRSSIVEAIKQAVSARGLDALKEPATRERFRQCDNAARNAIDQWITDFKQRELSS
jgi:hypothetical protein